MIYNVIMDRLRGRESPPDWHFMGDRVETARVMKKAEVFDFGVLALERHTDHSFLPPKLTAEELNFFKEGYVPVPAPYVWYEFIVDGYHSGLLVTESFEVMRIDLLDGSWGAWIKAFNEDYTLFLHDDERVCVWAEQNAKRLCMRSHIDVAMYLTLMINSKSTERERRVGERTAEQKAHNRHGQPDHTVVTIVPSKWHGPTMTDGGGTHASPRLHWRRSHLRQYKAPSGEVYHRVVIPRHLVGKADSGTITHIYRVKK